MNSPVFDSKYVMIHNIRPLLDEGRYPVKRRQGDSLTITCEALRHGHEKINVNLSYRHKSRKKWQEVPMNCVNAGLDKFEVEITLDEIGAYEFSILGYTDFYMNVLSGVKKKRAAGEDIYSDVLELIALLEECQGRANKTQQKKFIKILDDVQSILTAEQRLDILEQPRVCDLAQSFPDKTGFHSYRSPVYPLWVDRLQAEYATWYEIFPRSASPELGRSGTFKDLENLLPYFTDMGFDVLYFTPIHPIGLQKRKGKNNSLTATKGEPGSPYAIGSEAGGHFAVHPDLGTLDDFDNLVAKSAEAGMEIALDIALNCSPDHEYLKDHPDWFYKRPDGSIKYAENPPKKYEDIYPLNFECEDRKNLWIEIRNMFLFWCEHGVKTFRVDNPHTKPILFWQWCIEEVHNKYPDAIFLAEAFTRPRLMELLAKAGFSQSYGYFTWRETKADLIEYFDYLNSSEITDYMICNVFPTTPDILPKHLQHASSQVFRSRFALAATLSPVYGMYSGYELSENIPVDKRDELLNSEKYEYIVRDFNSPDSLAPFITKVNQIRKDNPALQAVGNLKFLQTSNENILAYVKKTEDNTLIIVVNLSPDCSQDSFVHVDATDLGFIDQGDFQVHDLITEQVYSWSCGENYIRLSQEACPTHIFRVF